MTAAKRKKVAKPIAIWKRMSFWEKIERTLTTLGGSAILLESIFGAGPLATGITAGFTVLAQHLAVWFDDKNGDGVADVFQVKEQVTVTVTDTITTTKNPPPDEIIP